MSLSRRAKQGISAFSKIQWNLKRAMYHLSPKMMVDLEAKPPLPPLNPELATAATEAMDILVRNGEKANALQKLSDSQANTVPPDAEGGTEHSVSIQPEGGEDRPESSQAGA